jgi:hypothetical protein
VLKAIGFAVQQVADALQDVFLLAVEAVGDVLKEIGYALGDIAQALHDVFGIAEDALKGVLLAIGFAEDAIDAVFDALECLFFPPSCFF